MPILDVEIVGLPGNFPDDLVQRIADGAGAALDSRPRGTWVKLTFLRAGRYAENGGVEEGVSPVFVRLIQGQIPSPDQLQGQITRLAWAISTATGVPSDNVHIIIEPDAKGRVAFGGKLIE